ncbi:MAG TPA: Gldg family protein [Stellaceae bacterium]|nr:Gldg family protein [Stellaceae bacterium]
MTGFPLSRRAAAAVAIVCAAILLVAINVIAEHILPSARLDLTQRHLYTLSDGSKKTLAHIDEPITLRYYYSPRLGDEVPSYGIYAQRVREMLEEYAALAKGKIRLEILDPQPFSPTEDRAVAFGLQGVPIDQGGEQVYFGLAATNSTDDQQVIPFFQPERERFLEYDLTKLVHSLAFPKKTVVGLATSLPLEGDFMAAMQGRPLQPYTIVEQLRQLYDVRTLSPDFDKVDGDIDVLMIAHPQGLSEKTLYAIDQFVLKGGKALVFVDPYSETQAAHANRMNPSPAGTASNLDKLFAAWGLDMVPGKVAGDRRDARRVNAGTGSRVLPIDYVAWLALKEDNLNKDNLVTGDLSQINLASAGILTPRDGAATTFTPLITTSEDSEEIPVDKVEGLPDVAGLLSDFKSDNKKLTLAAQITGPAKTAFPDGPPKAATSDKDKGDKDKEKNGATEPAKTDAAKPEGQESAPAQVKASAQPIHVIVVADTDILDDRFWVQVQDFFGQRVAIPTAGNGDFVTNAVDVLSGGNDLIGLRTRGTSARPFEVVQNIQRAADERYQAREKDLEQQLKDTEAKIKDLRGKGGAGGNVTLAAEQVQAIDNFRAQMLDIRRELRGVQLNLRQDIDRLKAALEFFDIAFIPLLVGVAAIVLGIMRMQRRKRRAQAQ